MACLNVGVVAHSSRPSLTIVHTGRTPRGPCPEGCLHPLPLSYLDRSKRDRPRTMALHTAPHDDALTVGVRQNEAPNLSSFRPAVLRARWGMIKVLNKTVETALDLVDIRKFDVEGSIGHLLCLHKGLIFPTIKDPLFVKSIQCVALLHVHVCLVAVLAHTSLPPIDDCSHASLGTAHCLQHESVCSCHKEIMSQCRSPTSWNASICNWRPRRLEPSVNVAPVSGPDPGMTLVR
eukprot:3863377-Rhodomonas_salina.4